jgi:hypothetical protein
VGARRNLHRINVIGDGPHRQLARSAVHILQAQADGLGKFLASRLLELLIEQLYRNLVPIVASIDASLPGERKMVIRADPAENHDHHQFIPVQIVGDIFKGRRAGVTRRRCEQERQEGETCQWGTSAAHSPIIAPAGA